MELDQCVCLQDFQINAKQKMSKGSYYYIETGAEDQITKSQNQKAFQRLIIMPRILISKSNPQMQCKILGHKLKYPFGFAPCAMNQLAHEDGELIPARIAHKYNICYGLSLLSTKPIELVSKQNQKGLRLLQMYVAKDWQTSLKTIQLAQKNGFSGLAITVDAQILGLRHKQKKYKLDSSIYKLPIIEYIHNQNSQSKLSERKQFLSNRDLSLNWETIKKIRSITKLKIVLKGIMHPLDAKIAKDYCDAIWVSNHGGRQLDNVPATIQVLPQIRAAVGQKMEIYIDGGIRSGNDVFKCLALGANYVFVGRSIIYSLTYGQDGVEKMLKRTMILAGCKSLKQIQPKFIKQSPNL